VERERSGADVASALKAEVEGWRPRRMPDLIELAAHAERPWERPVALASALGATALAIVLLLSVVIVMLMPSSLPGMAFVKDHLATPPFR
jgi:hypothetical protein